MLAGMSSARIWISLLLAALSWAQSTPVEAIPVDRDVLLRRLGQFATKNKERGPGLRRIFEEAGCVEPNLSDQKVKGSRYPNVICTLPGEAESTIIVGAHFDFYPAGQGVVDNWSGASLLPSLYQGLAASRRRHAFVFVGFTGEEEGLLGSRGFVKQLSPDARYKLRGMVNLDSLGLSGTKVWVSASDRKLVNLLATVAVALKLPLEAVNVGQVGFDDAQPFAEEKIPTISIHSVTQAKLPILHSSEDKLRAVDLDHYHETYRLVLVYLGYLDKVLP